MEASEAGASGAVVPATKRPAYQEWRVLFAIVAVTVIAMIAALMGTRGMDPLRADSASYIVFDPSRTIGYPAFIGLVRLLTANSRSRTSGSGPPRIVVGYCGPY